MTSVLRWWWNSLLANVSALKEGRGEDCAGGELHETESQFLDQIGGRSHRHEDAAWVDSTSAAVNKIERVLI